MAQAVSGGQDLEYVMIDGSIVLVHQHGAAQKIQKAEAMGKSRGGFSTKIHAAVDALGNSSISLLVKSVM